MKKKMLLSVLLILFLASCNFFSSGPDDILTKYLNSRLKGNYSEAYALLSAKDKNFKNQQKFEAEFSGNPYSKLVADKASFNVKEIKVNGNNADATVEMTFPDLSKAWADLMGVAFSSAFGGTKDEKAMEKMIAEKLMGKSLPMTTSTQTYNLVKDKEGWRVFLNWEGTEKAVEFSKQATQLEKSNEFEKAKAKYQEALSLDKNNKTAQGGLAGIDKKIEAYKAKKVYFDKIEVRNVRVNDKVFSIETWAFGEIKNTGDRTLKTIELTIYGLDSKGKPVFEKRYNRAFVGPMKPNYSKNFAAELDDAPSDWSKKVKVAVTDIEFQ
ncbi:MAG: hypothetical protein KKE00_08765 [Proteobacteria bacterium]|nr:hypothetical protein [Pseudomonadota bacterium]